MKTTLKTILTSLAIAAGLSIPAVRAADNDQFASINGGPGNGAGFVYQYTPAGTQSTFLSGLNRPRGLAFGSGGNIFMATNTNTAGVNNATIVQVAPDGTITTFATGFGANNFLEALAFDSAGNLFANSSNLSDPDNVFGTVFKITPDGAVTTFGSVLGQGFGLAIDSSDNVFAASGSTDRTIYRFTPAGVRTVFVGPSAFATNQVPIGLIFDSSGNLVVTAVDGFAGTGEILKFAPDTTKTVFATGLGGGPRGMAYDSDGNLFVAEVPPTTAGDILKFSPSGTRSTFASGLGSSSGNGGAEYLAIKAAPCGCVGPQGPAGPPGATGATGPAGPPGPGLVSGATLLMKQGSAAPAGFTKLGTTDFQYKDLAGKGQKVVLDVYQKP